MPRRPGLCSVIIPAYNASAFIDQAVSSALAQTYERVEVIVIDDGSLDATARVLQDFNDRITWETQPNRGPAAARNRALEIATGEFIGLLDADDRWARTRVERLVTHLRSKPDIGLVSSDAYIVRDEEIMTKTFYAMKRLPRRWFEDQARLIVQNNFFFGSPVIRHELFDRHGSFDETVERGVEDWELWIRFLSRGERLDLVLEPLAYYRRHTGSLSEIPTDERGTRSAFIEQVVQRPEVRRLSGTAGIVPYVRGVECLARGDGRGAKEHFKLALSDPDLPTFRRAKALVGATAPQASTLLFRVWRWVRRRGRV